MNIAEDEAKRSLLADHRVPKAVLQLLAIELSDRCQKKDGAFRVQAAFDVKTIRAQVESQDAKLADMAKGCSTPRSFLPFARARHHLAEVLGAVDATHIPDLELEQPSGLPRCSLGAIALDADPDDDNLTITSLKGALSDAGAAFAGEPSPGVPTLKISRAFSPEGPSGGGAVHRWHLEVRAEMLDAAGLSVASGSVSLTGVGTSESEAQRDAERAFAATGVDQLLDFMVKGGGA